tara:strand:- start:149 stop:625 length:477 start_codon:yes stop_codon:yes gene_type:complete
MMELWSLIELGARTTAGAALLWVLVAGLLGLAAIRFAGTQVLARLQAAQREGALQQHLLAGDMALAIAGLLLIAPGLISDLLALLIMIPPFRGWLGKLMGLRGVKTGAQFTHSFSQPQADAHARSEGGDGVILEGEFQEVDATPAKIQRQGPEGSGRS